MKSNCPQKEKYLKYFERLKTGKMDHVNKQSEILEICNSTIRLYLNDLIKKGLVVKAHRSHNYFEFIKVKI